MKMKKHLTRARIIGYILLFCAVTMTILPSTLARYRTRIEGGAVASVALWGKRQQRISDRYKWDEAGK